MSRTIAKYVLLPEWPVMNSSSNDCPGPICMCAGRVKSAAGHGFAVLSFSARDSGLLIQLWPETKVGDASSIIIVANTILFVEGNARAHAHVAMSEPAVDEAFCFIPLELKSTTSTTKDGAEGSESPGSLGADGLVGAEGSESPGFLGADVGDVAAEDVCVHGFTMCEQRPDTAPRAPPSS